MTANIIKQMTADCQRDDCRFDAPQSGVGNSAGSSSVWSCQACGRQWSVFTPAYRPTTYDKNGDALPRAEQPQRVTERQKT